MPCLLLEGVEQRLVGRIVIQSGSEPLRCLQPGISMGGGGGLLEGRYQTRVGLPVGVLAGCVLSGTGFRVRTIVLRVDPGIELRLTVFVTLRRVQD